MLEEFLDQYESNNTIRAYYGRLKRFLGYLDEKNKRIDQLTQKDVITFLQGYKKTTANNYLTAIKTYYKYVTDKQLNVDSEKVDTYRPDRNTALDEVQQLIYAAKNIRDKAIIKLLFETGIRVNELASLTRDDLKYSKSSGHYIQFIAKGRKERTVKISKENYNLLKQVASDKKTITGITARQIQRILGSVSQKVLNKVITPHCLRHGFATELMKQGISFDRIQRALGHENIVTTLKYLHNKRDADSWNINLNLYPPRRP